MHPLWILLIGMMVVVGGVLAARLHAFLVLILGALVVAGLTPRAAVYRTTLKASAMSFSVADGQLTQSDGDAGASASASSSDPDAQRLSIKAGPKQGLVAGGRLLVFRGQQQPAQTAVLEVVDVGPKEATARVLPDAEGNVIRLEPGDLVVQPVAAQQAEAVAAQSIGERVATGFGNTCLGIGILIALAAIVGKCLLDSGAAERIVLSARHAVGEEHTPLAFLGSGFIVGIPVFFDTVFYLLIPLGKALYVRTGRNYLLYILAIVAGATMAHSLVPPTPGPLFVADRLGVDLGVMMLAGCAIGIFTVASGYLYALWANRRWEVPLRESAELTASELEQMAQRDPRALPALWLSLLPILLPVVLIAGKAVIDMVLRDRPAEAIPAWLAAVRPLINSAGNKNIALAIAAIVALGTLVRQKRPDREQLAASLQTALAGGGIIILITAAGGAFGHTLRQTGIAEAIGQMMPSTQAVLMLPLAFLITAVVRVAQGSATVAMITAVGIIAPLAAAESLPFHPVYLALAIGCGSKPLPWMNDSGFWVIGRMSGMTEAETLKTVTVMNTVMGFVGLALTVLAARMLPLV